MRNKPIIAVLSALALVAAPTAAVAQRAAPASAPAGANAEVEPGAETVEGEELRRRGFILPLLAIIAIVIAVILLTGEDEDPISP